MSTPIDLTGQRFGRLIVLERMHSNERVQSMWMCKCDCGTEKTVRGSDLKNGSTKSCGCLRNETTKKRSTKHGHSARIKVSKIYVVWCNIIQRCTNANNTSYHNYGGRGITICNRWKKFENFLEDVGEPPTNKHTLDRIDNNKRYCKSNCRWATRKQQQRNTRRNHMITFNNKTQCLTAWAEEMNIDRNTLSYRLKRGWSIERALIAPTY